MKAAVLCPGPSLGSWDAGTFKPYDFRVAVNRAVRLCPVEWWCFFDTTPFIDCRRILGPKVFTIAEVQRQISHGPHAEDFAHFNVSIAEHRFEECPHSLSWCSFTATGAITLAGLEGATQIDVYGADWTDQPDWDGKALDGNRRNADRWAFERNIWTRMVDWLAGRGAIVQRMKPDGIS